MIKNESGNPARTYLNLSQRTLPWLGAFAILIAVIHGSFLTKIGFFWDDWMVLLVREKLTPAAYIPYYAVDRPTSAWVNLLFFGWMRDDPTLWHLFACLETFLIAALVFTLLNSLWENRRFENGMATLLFIAAPIFSQTFISVAYSQHHIQFICFLLSLLLTIRAERSESAPLKIGLTAAALFFMGLQLSVTEYFLASEWIRIPMIWILIRRKNPSAARKVSAWSALKAILPYALLWGLALVYRFNIDRWFPILEAEEFGILNDFRANPIQAIRTAFESFTVTILYPFFNFPGKILSIDLERFFQKTRLLFLVLSSLTGFGVFRFLNTQSGGEPAVPNESGRCADRERLLFAALWVCFGIAPFIVIKTNLLNDPDPYHADRLYYAAAPALAMIAAAIIRLIVGNPRMRAIVFALMITLNAYQHMIINDQARLLTRRQQSFYRQLKLRIPAIADQTALVDTNVVFPEQGNAFTASAVNILYPNPLALDRDIPIWLYAVDDRSFDDHPGFHTQKRIFRFNAPKENAILIDYDNPFANCLWVFMPDDHDHPHLSDVQRSWIRHSAVDRIRPIVRSDNGTPDKKTFGRDNPTAWCTLYQKAAAALQFSQFDELSALTSDALAAGYRPSHRAANSPYEWIPFLTALYRSGQTGLADELRAEALGGDPAYRGMYQRIFDRD